MNRSGSINNGTDSTGKSSPSLEKTNNRSRKGKHKHRTVQNEKAEKKVRFADQSPQETYGKTGRNITKVQEESHISSSGDNALDPKYFVRPKTQAEERDLIQDFMKPYKSLSIEQRRNAMLKFLQGHHERIYADLNNDTKGRTQNISCVHQETFASMFERWVAIAEEDNISSSKTRTYIACINTPERDNSYEAFVYETRDPHTQWHVFTPYSSPGGNPLSEDVAAQVQHQVGIMNAQQCLGMPIKSNSTTIYTPEYLGLTERQRSELVGKHSEYIGRPFTAEDIEDTEFMVPCREAKPLAIDEENSSEEAEPRGPIHNNDIVLTAMLITGTLGVMSGALYDSGSGKSGDSASDIKDFVQPALGKTEAEEYAYFQNLMEPYKDLSEDQQQKAVLLLMQDRLREHISYDLDADTEGVGQYTSSPGEILADDGKGIDCEDYAVMCERWAGYAKNEGLLPEDSKTYIVSVNTPEGDNPHAIFVYETNGNPPERYVIDTYTTSGDDLPTGEEVPSDGDLSPDPDELANNDDLVSYDEYFDNTNFEIQGFRDFSYDPNNPGQWSWSDNVFHEQWESQVSGDNTIGASITKDQLIDLQTAWLANGNSLETDLTEDNLALLNNQIDLIEAQQLIGKVSGDGQIITADSLGLTEQQRSDLAGKFSEHYGRPFTEEDLSSDAQPEMPDDADSLPLTEDGESIIAGAEASQQAHCETVGDLVIDQLYTPENYTNAAQLGTEIAGSVLESTLVTAFAQYKLYKIKQRRRAIKSAYKIKGAREKELFRKLASPAPESGSLNEERVNWQKLLSQKNQSFTKEELGNFIKDLHLMVQWPPAVPDLDAGEQADTNPLKKHILEHTHSENMTMNTTKASLKKMGIEYSSSGKTEKGEKKYKLTMDMDKLYAYLKAESHVFPDLFSFDISENIITKTQFRQYANLCFLEAEYTDQELEGRDEPLKNILKQRNCYAEQESLSQFLDDVIRLNSASDQPLDDELSPARHGSPLNEADRQTLKTFCRDLKKAPKETLQEKTRIKKVNKVLAKLGIKIDYNTDKLLGSLRTDSKAVLHKIEINPDKLYPQLMNMDRLPNVKAMDQILQTHNQNIDALYTLKDYDQWKLVQHKVDRNLKLASAVAGLIPVSLGIDEWLKAAAYSKERFYREDNKGCMEIRINAALDDLKEGDRKSESLKTLENLHEEALTQERLATISNSLTTLLRSVDPEKKIERPGFGMSDIKNSKISSEGKIELDENDRKHLKKHLQPYGISADSDNKIKIDINKTKSEISAQSSLIKWGWKETELRKMIRLLENAKMVKDAHIDVKKVRASTNTGIHVTAAIADPFSNLMGPIGRGVKAGVKGSAKIGVAVGSAVDRYRQDKKLKQQDNFSEPKDIYQFYKTLYTQAAVNSQKRKSIERLAAVTFGVTEEGFRALVQTELVENKLFKLSFSQRRPKEDYHSNEFTRR